MKKLFAGLILMMATATVLAEASFSQIESLIEQRQYGAAEQGLEEIIKNHPQSAKAFYAMAQAQAGLGHLDKARYALDKAQGLEPSLSFASSSNVETLRQAITPQSAKIEPVSEGHFWATLFALLFVGFIGWAIYKFITKRDTYGDDFGGVEPEKPLPRTPSSGPSANTQSPINSASARRNWNTQPSRPTGGSYQQPSVVNNYHNNNSSDLLTGVLLGEALSGNHHSHDSTTVVNNTTTIMNDTGRSSSWDDTSSKRDTYVSPVKSSSWDSDNDGNRSSSWDNNSSSSSSWGSSSSSSSWDSGSSSSDSSSSSSWD
jgi:hypothetical protein